jgi:hypothetical protein
LRKNWKSYTSLLSSLVLFLETLMSYIYLGSPYTSRDQAKMHWRFRQAGRAVVQLLNEGVNVYSPIVHCHQLAHDFNMPKDFDFWQAYNFSMLEPASMLMILKLDGWKESKGLDGEIGFAMRHGIPVEFMDWPK